MTCFSWCKWRCFRVPIHSKCVYFLQILPLCWHWGAVETPWSRDAPVWRHRQMPSVLVSISTTTAASSATVNAIFVPLSDVMRDTMSLWIITGKYVSRSWHHAGENFRASNLTENRAATVIMLLAAFGVVQENVIIASFHTKVISKSNI